MPFTPEEIEKATKAIVLLKSLAKITTEINRLWNGVDSSLLAAVLTEHYPESLPSFDEHELQIKDWAEDSQRVFTETITR
jgi:hypothetical protein